MPEQLVDISTARLRAKTVTILDIYDLSFSVKIVTVKCPPQQTLSISTSPLRSETSA